VYTSYTYDFRCERGILDIQSAWLSLGPYEWRAFENEQYGSYIVARVPELNLKTRVLGEAPNYSLEMYFDVEPNLIKQTKSQLFSTMFEKRRPWELRTSVTPVGRQRAGRGDGSRAYSGASVSSILRSAIFALHDRSRV
jgi:hypothetical protein